MKRTAVLFAEGLEEVEALTVVDLLRRAGIGCDIIALADADRITGSHGITVLADACFSRTDFDLYDGIILPGGMPGTRHLAGDEQVLELLRRFHAAGKLTAAICAAPTVLAKAGLLEGKKAVCYPGNEGKLTGALLLEDPVAEDGSIITSRGVGTAIPFSLALVRYLETDEAANALAKAIVFV